MKRILLLVTVALLLAAAMALSGVAQAKPTIDGSADAKCLAEAAQTLQPGFNPGTYTFHGGTEGIDVFSGQGTAGLDVFCGFGGDDRLNLVDVGDIFLGGAGDDAVGNNIGTVYGGEGNDFVFFNFRTFDGGEGTDRVIENRGGTLISVELVG
jgi:Ca2+-binding RTX toxin-like protein